MSVAVAPQLEVKLRQTQLLGMLMERALHDREATWQTRALGTLVPLSVTKTDTEVAFSAEVPIRDSTLSEGEIRWEVVLDGEPIYVVTTTVPPMTQGDALHLTWSISPYRLALI